MDHKDGSRCKERQEKKEEIRRMDKKNRSNWKAWGQSLVGGWRGGEMNLWRGRTERKKVNEMSRNGRTDGC